MIFRILVIAFVFVSLLSQAQQADSVMVKSIFDYELTNGRCYSTLEYLTTKIGGRLSGSANAAKAVDWTAQVMKEFADSVWLQPVMVPHWERGKKETGRIVKSKVTAARELSICALGGSVGTGAEGITANVIEVKNFEELKNLGEQNVKGKIVFFNRGFDQTKINTFAAYGGAVDQRGGGASEAAKYGAKAVIVRSMGSGIEDYPHTGSLRYSPNLPMIPAVAVSTKDADVLSDLLRKDSGLQLFLQTNSQTLADASSFNVIGEIKGSELPEEILVVGGHLDSWDLGQGAHDDGTGCVQSMEVLRILKSIGYKPKRTIRAVMFMNEENGLRGGQEYATQASSKKEKHIAAIESDRGGFTPRGFAMMGRESAKAKIRNWKNILEPYGLTDFSQTGSGADIGPLASQDVTLLEFLPDSQRYFSYHHTPEDTFDKVNRRELELGAASMAALIYLIDKNGL